MTAFSRLRLRRRVEGVQSGDNLFEGFRTPHVLESTKLVFVPGILLQPVFEAGAHVRIRLSGLKAREPVESDIDDRIVVDEIRVLLMPIVKSFASHPPRSDLAPGISRSDRGWPVCRMVALRTF